MNIIRALVATQIITAAFFGLTTYYLYTEIGKLKSIELTSNIDIQGVIREAIRSEKLEAGKKVLLEMKEKNQLANNPQSTHLSYGNSAARYTIEFFSDIECPYCRKMFPNLKQVVDHSKGVINAQYRHFPLQRHNPTAAIEAQAIECIASNQGNQLAWIALEKMMIDTVGNGAGIAQSATEFAEWGRSFGLNGSMLQNCLLSDAYKQKINDDYGYGLSLGIMATPAILLKDNQSSQQTLLKGYQSAEDILRALTMLQ